MRVKTTSRRPRIETEREWFVRRLQGDSLTPLGTLTYRQSTIIIGILSTTFAVSIGCHEVIVEGGFDTRNYVAIAFCVIWLIVNIVLLVGAYLRAPFMMLPWMALMVALTPIFIVAIVVGIKLIHSCAKYPDEANADCLHEYHVLGTTDHVLAGFKLVLLAVMLTANSLSGVFVYQFYRMLSESASSAAVTPPGECESTLSAEYRPTTFSYLHRYQLSHKVDGDRQPCLPLCDDIDEISLPNAQLINFSK